MKEVNKVEPSVSQDEIHGILFSRELGWQEIIYDLINTEQLNPWDIDLAILSEKYLTKIENLEEADFFVSSQVLLAASLLLRIKSEILLNKYIQSIDDILFGKKEEKKYEMERIELDENIPELIPRSPMPRFKKITLNELMEALNKAITTENRRIKKAIVNQNALREIGISLPKIKFNIKDKIKEIYGNLSGHFEKNQDVKKVGFHDFIGKDREQKIIAFGPLLHLENQKKVWLDQDNHFDEIYIWLHKKYMKHNPDPFAELREEIEEQLEEMSDTQKQKIEKINSDFENPLGEMFD